MENRFQFLSPGDCAFSGVFQDCLAFTLHRQLLSPDTWADFVRVFTADSDDADKGWRCEYWGKMMRGACLCFQATGSEKLYLLLRDTVRSLLRTQRPDGRISTYSAARQFSGWDLWGRKYVMTGLLHFLDICREEALRGDILAALIRHADAILDRVGPGKTEITETSDYWGGVNSCSILEPFMALYARTREDRYLRFAEYILSTGGCRDGNLIEIALENKIPPYQYPEVKAYETMSFFEGVLAYYEATGKEAYFRAVLHFFDAVAETDLTVIGCCGCTHELFDHSAVRQAEPSQSIMQETCVSVTWMRLCARLLLLTGDSRYYGFIERTGLNALYGAVNRYDLPQYDRQSKETLPALPFDSYSPLTQGRRGVGIGGLKRFAFGGFYGCCACIASAGVALLPLTTVLQARDGLVINGFFSGEIAYQTPEGKRVRVTANTGFPREGNLHLTFAPENGQTECAMYLRIQDDLNNVQIMVNGEAIALSPAEGGYLRLERAFAAGDTLEIRGTLPLITETIGDSEAYRYGPVVLALDGQKEPDERCQAPETDKKPAYRLLPPEGDEMLRLMLWRKPDAPPLLFSDYASCGKRWNQPKSTVTVWLRPESTEAAPDGAGKT